MTWSKRASVDVRPATVASSMVCMSGAGGAAGGPDGWRPCGPGEGVGWAPIGVETGGLGVKILWRSSGAPGRPRGNVAGAARPCIGALFPRSREREVLSAPRSVCSCPFYLIPSRNILKLLSVWCISRCRCPPLRRHQQTRQITNAAASNASTNNTTHLLRAAGAGRGDGSRRWERCGARAERTRRERPTHPAAPSGGRTAAQKRGPS